MFRRLTEHDCWKQKGQPESNVLLSIDHTDGSNQGSHVDHEVEVQEDTRSSDSRVHDDTLTLGGCLDSHDLLGAFGSQF